ncbi:MFS transporter [Ideonella livida]|uniref:MFS transporter n=1 Tax=Ideonella livida TaxID=2707176 RepID=A0A7C9TJM5_9BURK|nr:MFS transporter [Ideonella livida]NDY91858.1 MFS transporter [Ideonella livida]
MYAPRQAVAAAPGLAQALTLIAVVALPTMAIVSLVPNLPQLFAHFGQTPHAPWLVPMILTLPSLCVALLSPLAGQLVDRWGRRPVLLLSLVLFTAIGVLPVFMESLHAVLWTRLAVGLAEAGIFTSQNALLGDYFEGPARQRWLGWQSILSPVLAAGLVVVGGALGSLHWQAPFLLYLLGVPVLAAAFWCLPEPARPHASQAAGDAATVGATAAPTAASAAAPDAGWPWPVALRVAGVTLAVSALYFVQAVQLGRLLAEHGLTSPERIGFYVMLSSVGVLAGGWVFTRLPVGRLPLHLALVLGCYGLGFLGLGGAPALASALAAALVAQFGNGVAIPALIAWALGRFPLAHRGRGMGLWSSCFFAGSFLSPLMLQALQAATGGLLPAVAWLGACSLGVAVALAAVGWRAKAAPTPALR